MPVSGLLVQRTGGTAMCATRASNLLIEMCFNGDSSLLMVVLSAAKIPLR